MSDDIAKRLIDDWLTDYDALCRHTPSLVGRVVGGVLPA
jgi:hypothetical protein